MALAASAIVNAEVTLRPRRRTDFNASASCSSNAATTALDSMYRTPVVSAAEAGDLALRFATVGVDQLGGGPSWKADRRPPFCRVTSFERWANHARGEQLVEAARRALRLCARRHKLRNHATVSRDRNAFPGLNPSDVAAQIVLELADPCGGHHWIIATCAHIRQARSLALGCSSASRPCRLARSSTWKRSPGRGQFLAWARTRTLLQTCPDSHKKTGARGRLSSGSLPASLGLRRVVDEHRDVVGKKVGHGQVLRPIPVELPHGHGRRPAARAEVPRRLETPIAVAQQNRDVSSAT